MTIFKESLRLKRILLLIPMAAALLLAACSDRVEKEEFATVTISLENSEASRQLVGLGEKPGTTSETHTYRLIAKKGSSTFGPIDMDIDAATGNLKASGVPTGDITLEVRAYGIADDIWKNDDGSCGHPFGEGPVLRAMGLTFVPVPISASKANTVEIDLYSATEVSTWEQLEFAASDSGQSEGDLDREEYIILKGDMVANSKIRIRRPITIWAEKDVTISRGDNFDDSFFNLYHAGVLFIAAFSGIEELEFLNNAIILDGGGTKGLTAYAPLIMGSSSFVCTIGEKVILQNNNVAIGNGGGVSFGGGTFTLYGTIKNNTVTDAKGGGVAMGANGTFIMKNGAVIEGNKATSGGGVSMESGTFIMENGAVIEGNIAETGGGGVAITFGNVDNNNGFTVEAATFEMNGGVIRGNTGSMGAGGVDVIGATFNMNGGSITGNMNTFDVEFGAGGVMVRGAYDDNRNLLSAASFNMTSPAKPGLGNSITGNSGGATLTQNLFISINGGATFTSDKSFVLSDDGGW